MVEKRPRTESGVSAGAASDLDLNDLETCILCFNPIRFFAMGSCDHKNVCHKCVLRIRLCLEDIKCSICKTELEEIVISQNKSLTWEEFEDELREKALVDREDKGIFYEDPRAKAAGMQLRSLQCLMYNCNQK